MADEPEGGAALRLVSAAWRAFGPFLPRKAKRRGIEDMGDLLRRDLKKAAPDSKAFRAAKLALEVWERISGQA